MKKGIVFVCSLLCAPVVAFAQITVPDGSSPTALDKLIFSINKFIINPAIATLFIIAFVIFMYGMIQFLSKANDKDGKSNGSTDFGLVASGERVSNTSERAQSWGIT